MKRFLSLSSLKSIFSFLLLTTGLIFNFNSRGQIITTFAGNGNNGASVDSILATSAQLYGPNYVATDALGNVYFSDGHRIRKVDASNGLISTIAGSNSGFTGDGNLAIYAELDFPAGIAFDNAGNIYIADWGNNRIRKITVSTGIINTIVGNGTVGLTGNGGLAISAALHNPSAITIDNSGNIYFVDGGNNVVRKVDSITQIITIIAGNGYCGCAGYAGDSGMADTSELDYPTGIAVDASGNVFIADKNNSRIRKVSASTGIISTIAGTGIFGYSGDGGPAISAKLFEPSGISIAPNGDLYISDKLNVVRKITANTGIITTIAGDTTMGFSGDGGLATLAELNQPSDLALDPSGNVFIADQGNYRVRKVKSGSSGIDNIISNEDFEIYPVPNNGVMNLHLNSAGNISIKIYNAIGIEVYARSFDKSDSGNDIVLDMGNVASGIYALQLLSQVETMSKRIVVQK